MKINKYKLKNTDKNNNKTKKKSKIIKTIKAKQIDTKSFEITEIINVLGCLSSILISSV